MNVNDSFDKQKIDRVKELLEIPSIDRTDKNLLELMSFTKVNSNFFNIIIYNKIN